MPRKGKKTSKGGGQKGQVSLLPPSQQKGNLSDDDSMFDTESVLSGGFSNMSSAGDEEEEQCAEEIFEEKFCEALDDASGKSLSTRLNGLKFMCDSCGSKYTPDFISDRYMTILDVVERSIRKGKGAEQVAACQLCLHLILQLGASTEAEHVFTVMCPFLLILVADPSGAPQARVAAASTLGLGAFFADREQAHTQSILNALQALFCQSYQKGDGSLPSLPPALLALHTAALDAWTLLVTLWIPERVLDLMDSKTGHHFLDLLSSPSVELRISAGESLALLHEVIRQGDDAWELEDHEDLVHKLRELATDASKFRGKRERKVQRSSFRDILRTVEDGVSPKETIKFGREKLHVDSWDKKVQYEAICNVLGSGFDSSP
ncbi:unnamed protein product [Cyprideis torosa]|uniref:Interferon-related developmental regulator N-terminal domain-containing protein n=1 Tax=Cyprideis torosa TaxID=163714 RepID=A0A7R8WHM3_9CRUS|nr:unnamed protein product [Cyprideis torosa]CAG0899534.1 unnamed protein product [Cyprideis torosa]